MATFDQGPSQWLSGYPIWRSPSVQQPVPTINQQVQAIFMEPIAPGVHPVDLFAREYDIRSAWFGVLELRALVDSGTVRVATRAVLGVELDPMATIAAELLGSSVSLAPLIRTTKCTYRVTVEQRGFIGIGVHFGCHLKCRPRVGDPGTGSASSRPTKEPTASVLAGGPRLAGTPRRSFVRPASLAGWPRPRSGAKRLVRECDGPRSTRSAQRYPRSRRAEEAGLSTH
jgi:hypothetical protein